MISDAISKIKLLMRTRKLAYTQTFNLQSVAVQAVLKDLSRFCRAHETTFSKDDRTTYMLEGRREVWLRIQNYLNLTQDQLYDLHYVKNKGE